MLVPVTGTGTQDRDAVLSRAIQATHLESCGLRCQETAATSRDSMAPSLSENDTSDTADRLSDELTDVRISGNRVLPRAIYDQVGDMECSQTLQRMAEDPRFMSICTEIWKMHHSATI
ncbi:hypothetical protein V7S43_016639 [Phytophthora oleae]|uniref:Uncharacterized protein n=1 Tax=Phytophthora oleae TaxID=2107226 RepID=A0ABD3EZ57_9STRA